MTCALAKVRIASWARRFRSTLKDNMVKVLLASSYVDDLRFVISLLKTGVRWEKDEFTYRV